MRTMPIEIHGGTVPAIPFGDWIRWIEENLGRSLTVAEHQWALKAGEHNWTATVTADAIRDQEMDGL